MRARKSLFTLLYSHPLVGNHSNGSRKTSARKGLARAVTHSTYFAVLSVIALLSGCGSSSTSSKVGGGGGSVILYSIGGTVTGLSSGASVQLANGSDLVTVSAAGSFTFPTSVATLAILLTAPLPSVQQMPDHLLWHSQPNSRHFCTS
jgi:hypothetical protein